MCALLRQDDDEQPVIPDTPDITDKGGQKSTSHVLPMSILKRIQRLANGIVNGHITLYIENGEYLGTEHAKRDFPVRVPGRLIDRICPDKA